jgi:TM2 domain-containing membrane protein YozV
MQGDTRVEPKSPRRAALLGLIFGVGHMYLGEWAKGILLLVVAIVVSVLTRFAAAPIFWIISPIWAYYDAKAYNRKAGYPE